MSKILFPLLMAIFLVGFFSGPGFALTDYPCLNACIQDGKSSAVCMPQCKHDTTLGKQTHAEGLTDYRCLNLCANEGKAKSECLSQCTYAKPTSKTAGTIASSPTASNHDILKAPIPVGDGDVVPPRTPKANDPNKDHACIRQCMQNGMQYQMCSQNCSDAAPATAK